MSLPQSILSLPLTSFPEPPAIITVRANTHLRAAVDTLLKNGVSSCPVITDDAVLVNDKYVNRQDIIGVVDLIDIVAFFLSINEQTQHWDRGFEQVFETVVQFADHTVGDIIKGGAQTLRTADISNQANVLDALKLLGVSHNHRLLLLDNNSLLVNVISQAYMLKFITLQATDNAENILLAKDLFDIELNRISLPRVNPATGQAEQAPLIVGEKTKIYSIKDTDKALAAFKIIHKNRVSGCCVTDSQTGELLGNISSKDIRNLVAEDANFENLYSTAREYLQLIKEDRDKRSAHAASVAAAAAADAQQQPLVVAPLEDNARGIVLSQANLPDIVTISPHDTVGYLMLVLEEYCIRRVYLTSATLGPKGKTVRIPIGIITLSDLMAIFAGAATVGAA